MTNLNLTLSAYRHPLGPVLSTLMAEYHNSGKRKLTRKLAVFSGADSLEANFQGPVDCYARLLHNFWFQSAGTQAIVFHGVSHHEVRNSLDWRELDR